MPRTAAALRRFICPHRSRHQQRQPPTPTPPHSPPTPNTPPPPQPASRNSHPRPHPTHTHHPHAGPPTIEPLASLPHHPPLPNQRPNTLPPGPSRCTIHPGPAVPATRRALPPDTRARQEKNQMPGNGIEPARCYLTYQCTHPSPGLTARGGGADRAYTTHNPPLRKRAPFTSPRPRYTPPRIRGGPWPAGLITRPASPWKTEPAAIPQRATPSPRQPAHTTCHRSTHKGTTPAARRRPRPPAASQGWPLLTP